ncbi:hypothetical protein [Streptomyces sp. NPDC047042]|uniref:hypothetical protein n=1 Tax=Streptomyces sp. NPDC047042 TaxID=3154807 RepID=UPI0034103F69
MLSPLRDDPQTLRIVAAENYDAARTRLFTTAATLRTTSTPAGPDSPPPVRLRTRLAAVTQPRLRARH